MARSRSHSLLGDMPLLRPIESISTASSQKHLLTLCVDDNAMNLRILDRTLRHHFPDLVDHDALLYAADGYQAIAQYKQHARTLDLVLLDIDMPGISGVQVAEEMRASPGGAGLVIIACTTSDTIAARARYADAGIDGCVCKPIDLRELDGALRHGLSLRRPDLHIIDEVVKLEPEQVLRTVQSPYVLKVKHFSLQQGAFPTLRHFSQTEEQLPKKDMLSQSVNSLLDEIPEDIQYMRSSRRPSACPIDRRHSMCADHPFKLSPVRICVDTQTRPTGCQLFSATQPQFGASGEAFASDAAIAVQQAAQQFVAASAASSQESLVLDRTQSAGVLTAVGQSAFDRFTSAAKCRLPFRTRTPEILMQPATCTAAT